MKIDFEKAKELRFEAAKLMEGPLWELMEEWAGKYKPQYDPSIPRTMDVAHGKAEVVQSIRNLYRLEEEQIVQIYQEGK